MWLQTQDCTWLMHLHLLSKMISAMPSQTILNRSLPYFRALSHSISCQTTMSRSDLSMVIEAQTFHILQEVAELPRLMDGLIQILPDGDPICVRTRTERQ